MPTIFCCNLHHPGLFLFSLDYFVWIFIKLNFFFFSRHIFCFYFWNCPWFCTYYGHFIFLSKFFLFCSFSFSTVQLKFIMYLDLRYSLCFLLRTFFILLFFKYIIFPIYIQNLHNAFYYFSEQRRGRSAEHHSCEQGPHGHIHMRGT